MPPDFNKTGRTNLNFAKNFAMTTPTTAIGPSAFFIRLQAVSSVGAYGSVFSPDGKFIAYSSAETGQNEIWVQPFPGRGARYQVSKDGAFWPFWSKDGRELFFNSRANGLVAVGITTQPSITFMLPAPVPVRFFTQQPTTPRNIDIFPDGTRFISVVLGDQAGTPAAQQIQVVLNWLEELKQRVPVP